MAATETQRRRHRDERGQALPLLTAVLVLAAVLAVVVADLGAAAIHRARAQAAADAAALAGAAGGEAEARIVAGDNGAELVSFTSDGVVVEVAVRHGPAGARATAEGVATGEGPDGLAPVIVAALERARQLLGGPVAIEAVTDGGLGVEVHADVADALAALADETGLCRRAPAARPVHFGPCPPTSPG